jgi:cation transport regulator ChaB
MPAKASGGASDKSDMPSTILRSEKHAQHLWTKARDSALKTYGEGGRAYRVAYAALKHEYEKRGDKWVRKPESGPSDPQAARGPTTHPASTDATPAPTAGGKVARTDAVAKVKQKQARKEYAQSRRKQTGSRT